MTDRAAPVAPVVAGVLVVPSPGDPAGLLAEGPCGARPPRATYDMAWSPRLCGYPMALVLAWDGEVVWEGALRLGIALSRTQGRSVERFPLPRTPQEARRLADVCVGLGIGAARVILLDADGREVGGG